MKNFEIHCVLHFESINMNTTVVSIEKKFSFGFEVLCWKRHKSGCAALFG